MQQLIITMLLSGKKNIRFVKMDKILSTYPDYREWFIGIKAAIREAQIKASLAVNSELIHLYGNLGAQIIEKQESAKWGNSVIEQLSKDLQNELPELKGFSRRNLYAVRQWYLFYNQKHKKVPQPVAQIPWGHNRVIVEKIKDVGEALFYCEETIRNGWSRNVLEIKIESDLYNRQGKAISNFNESLPPAQSDLVRETIKDPYDLGFLELEKLVHEKELEDALASNMTDFLLELGKGFAYVGRQYRLEINGNEYYIDLLFYHLTLRSYIVLELKTGKFKPEYAGKLNFYLSAVDDLLRTEHDNPSIGIILCKTKDKIEAEYALRDINKPIGIADFILTAQIPEHLKSGLPTVEELETELEEKFKKKD